MMLFHVLAYCLLVLGVVLLPFGLWPRRKGDYPYCRKCGYNLTGAISECCSECGSAITEKSVVRGKRQRRLGVIIVGILCVLPAVMLAIGTWAKVDSYKLIPVVFVANDLKSPTPSVSAKAWDELNRRIVAGQFSSSNYSSMIDACLVMQGRPVTLPANQLLEDSVEFLGDSFLSQRMTQKQAVTFFEQGIQVEFTARPQVVSGNPVPYRISYGGRLPRASVWLKVTFGPVLLNNQQVFPASGGYSTAGRLGTTQGRDGTVVCPEPGVHRLTASLVLTACTGSKFDISNATKHYEWKATFSDDFEALVSEPANYITMLGDDELTAGLRDCFQPRQYRYSPDGSSDYQGYIEVHRLPINVAFDVVVRIQGEETHIRALVRHREESCINIWFGWQHESPFLQSFDLVLRSNESLVRQSVDMVEAWQGELVYENIPITEVD